MKKKLTLLPLLILSVLSLTGCLKDHDGDGQFNIVGIIEGNGASNAFNKRVNICIHTNISVLNVDTVHDPHLMATF
jgi:hypothetical protein